MTALNSTRSLLHAYLSRKPADEKEFIADCADINALLCAKQGSKLLDDARLGKWIQENKAQLVATLDQRMPIEGERR